MPEPSRLLWLSALIVLTGLAAEAEMETMSRTTERFCDAWQFNLGEVEGAEAPAFDDAAWRTLNLPHDWSIELPFDGNASDGYSSGYLPGGIGWYRKTFTIPSSGGVPREAGGGGLADQPQTSDHRRVYIDFDGVYMDSQVWINGTLLGRRPFGYVSFRYDLTPHLKYGDAENHIAVRVNVEPNTSRWYPGAGIYRRVWLTTMDPVHVAHWGTFVTTPEVSREQATVRVTTEVENEGDAAATATLRSVIVDAEGAEIARAASSHAIAVGAMHMFDQPFVVKNPRLWSPDTPDLYEVVSTIEVGGRVVDRYTSPLGIRTCEFTTDRGFLLNGERVDIKGVCLHHDFGPIGTAFHPRALEWQLELLRDMGCNAIRTSHNPRDPEFYSICDRMGFLVMDEAFDVWETRKLGNDYHKFFKEWHERDLTSMLRRDRNHPCIFIWSIGNEVNEQHYHKLPDKQLGGKIATRLVEICRQHDPTRAVTAACNSHNLSGESGITEPLDVYGQNYGLQAYKHFKGPKPVIGTENATSFITRGSYGYEIVLDGGIKVRAQHMNNSTECTAYGTFWSPDRTEFTLAFMRRNPWVAGQFAWTGFDYLGECFPFAWPARNGLFGIIDMVGFPKESYYAYKSDWTDEPNVYLIPQNWNWSQLRNKPIPVWVYSNCEKVELFHNGQSQGVKTIARDEHVHAEWEVPYVAGELKAVGLIDGQPVCSNLVRTAGEPARLELAADRLEIAADGSDLSYVAVRLVDEDGVVCPDSDRMVVMALEGDGELLGVGNGNPYNHEPFTGDRVKTFHGYCRAILRSTRAAGAMRLEVSAEGLEGDVIEIAALPADSPRLAEAAALKAQQAREHSRRYSRLRIASLTYDRPDAAPESVESGAAPDEAGGPAEAATAALQVAPLFKHGPGQHADSVIVSRNKRPPVWSEAAACRVVIDELQRHGLTFTTQGERPRVEGILASRDGQSLTVTDETLHTPIAMTFDGVSQDGRIVFEVLTAEDVPVKTDNTDHITDFLGAAEKLVEELKTKSGGYTVGVFYDPIVGSGDAPDEEPLRMQVRDFVTWLKGRC